MRAQQWRVSFLLVFMHTPCSMCDGYVKPMDDPSVSTAMISNPLLLLLCSPKLRCLVFKGCVAVDGWTSLDVEHKADAHSFERVAELSSSK